MSDPIKICTAFAGNRRIASGRIEDVALAAKAFAERTDDALILVFDDETSEPLELDLRGSLGDVRERFSSPPAAPESRGPGRPKLGVVAREITLLPRHWDWLASQPGGASVALRRLVEDARRGLEAKDAARRAQEAAYRFMIAVAGNQLGFEEATRALFANDPSRFAAFTESWPIDVRDHARGLAARGFHPAKGA